MINEQRKKYGLPIINHNEVFMVSLNDCNKSQLKRMLNKNTGGRHRKKKRKQVKIIKSINRNLGALQMYRRKLKYAALDTKYQLMVENKLKLSNDIKIFEHPVANTVVSVIDLTRLDNGGWLNDELINTYVALLTDRNIKRMKHQNSPNISIFVFSSYFYDKLESRGYEGVKTWNKVFGKYGYSQKNVSEFDLVMFPIHVGSNHWVCGCIDFKGKTIEYFDSLNKDPKQYFKVIREYLMAEAEAVSDEMIDLRSWKDINHEDRYPQQHNFSDCGVFVIKCMDWICDRLYPDYSNDDMKYFRRRLMIEMIIGRTLD